MKTTTKHSVFSYYTLIVFTIILASCASTKKAVYFLNQQDTTFQSTIVPPDVIIHNNDLLSISVSSLSAIASNVFNTPNTTGTSATNTMGNAVQASGYLVNSSGEIKFPFLGKVKAAGLTETQLEDTITFLLTDKKLLVDPIITVRHISFKVTVLGEVNHPSVLIVASEKISFLEALGLAGDLTIYAKRDNVLLIREENNKKVLRRIDLNSNELFKSPYYYLKSNDVIYVEPNTAKVASAGRSQLLLPVIFSALSFAAIAIQVFKK